MSIISRTCSPSRRAARFAAALFTCLIAEPASAAEPLEVILDWFVNPDHAPLIVAKQAGMFAAAGLDVTLVEPADPNAPPKLVAAGKADLAVTYQPQLHLQVAEGLPLVRVATLVATPLNSLVVLKDGPIASIADLKGRKIGYSVGGFEDALLGAMLERHGLRLADVTLINVNFSLSPSLIAGQVDAVIGAFRNFELNQMDIVGRPGRAFFVEEEGVPAYDELIIVSRRQDTKRKAIVTFVRTIERAVQYILNHGPESWNLFKTYKAGLDDELNRRAWADTLPRLALRPAAVDGGRYVAFAAFLKARGLLKEALPADRYAVEVR